MHTLASPGGAHTDPPPRRPVHNEWRDEGENNPNYSHPNEPHLDAYTEWNQPQTQQSHQLIRLEVFLPP